MLVQTVCNASSVTFDQDLFDVLALQEVDVTSKNTAGATYGQCAFGSEFACHADQFIEVAEANVEELIRYGSDEPPGEQQVSRSDLEQFQKLGPLQWGFDDLL